MTGFTEREQSHAAVKPKSETELLGSRSLILSVYFPVYNTQKKVAANLRVHLFVCSTEQVSWEAQQTMAV